MKTYLVLWVHCLVFLVMINPWHVIMFFFEFPQDWTPFVFASRAILQVLGTTCKHHNNESFFNLVTWFQINLVGQLCLVLFVHILLGLDKWCITSLWSQLRCLGFLVWISSDAFEFALITFFLPLVFFWGKTTLIKNLDICIEIQIHC